MDLGALKYVQRVATQCRSGHATRQCVTSYYVNVSSAAADDNYTAVCGTDSCPQLFTGNDPTRDEETVATNAFDWPIEARFVRLNPQSWAHSISLRWEIYGCDSVN